MAQHAFVLDIAWPCPIFFLYFDIFICPNFYKNFGACHDKGGSVTS